MEYFGGGETSTKKREYRVVLTQQGDYRLQFWALGFSWPLFGKKWNQAYSKERWSEGVYWKLCSYGSLDEAINHLQELLWPEEQDIVVWP